MGYLIAGIVVFLGTHSVRIFANDWRSQTIARVGEKPFKGVYSLLSIAGFALLVWGFSVAREMPTVLWMPPRGMRHAASLLTLFSFILLAAAYVPANWFKARFHHPMVLGVKTWALTHLLANGNVAHIVLFGSFLVWGVLCFIAARRRDRTLGTVVAAASAKGTVTTVVAGVAAWAVFAFWLHGVLIGIRPFG